MIKVERFIAPVRNDETITVKVNGDKYYDIYDLYAMETNSGDYVLVLRNQRRYFDD